MLGMHAAALHGTGGVLPGGFAATEKRCRCNGDHPACASIPVDRDQAASSTSMRECSGAILRLGIMVQAGLSYITDTGLNGTATCTTTPGQCRKDERSIPCAWPFDSYCVTCDEPVPVISSVVKFTAATAKRVTNYEDYDTTHFWEYNVEATAVSNAVTPRLERLQDLKYTGARNSQIWLSMVSWVKPAGTLPEDAVMLLYVRCDNTPVFLNFGRDTNERKIANCGEWTQVIAPVGPGGFTVTGMGGATATISIDEISLITSLAPPYPGKEPSWCVAGMFKSGELCVPCSQGNACPSVEGHQDIIQCPPDSRPLPSSNTCICPANSKAVPNGGSMKCQDCTVDEDCNRGYVPGTLVAWYEPPGETASKRKQLSCGPLSCCAVDQAGEVLCWGDNTGSRLGNSLVTKPWIPPWYATPVQGLHAPAIAVAVSQQVTADASNNMSCALLEDGTTKCWGRFKPCADNFGCSGSAYECSMGIEDVTDDQYCLYNNATHAAERLWVSSGTACVENSAKEIWCWGRDLWTGSADVQRSRRWDDLLLGVPTFLLAVGQLKDVALASGGSFDGMNMKILGGTGDERTFEEPTIRAAGDTLSVVHETGLLGSSFGTWPPLSFGDGVLQLWTGFDQIGQIPKGTMIKLLEVSVHESTRHVCWKMMWAGVMKTFCIGGGSPTREYRVMPALQTATVIALNYRHGCAGLENGDVVCWGDGASGYLENTACPAVDTDSPVLVAGLKLWSPKQPLRHTWTRGGDVAYAGTADEPERGNLAVVDTVEWVQSSWQLPYQAYISCRLEVVDMTHGIYISDNENKTDAHWVQVYVYVSCAENVDNVACTLVLARNLHSVTDLDADHIFHVEDINPGDSKQISSVVWAYHWDSISVLSYAVNTMNEVMSVSAFEDNDSCAYTCPPTHHMRNRDCVECSMEGVTQCTHNQSAQRVPCIDPLATSSEVRFTGQGENACMYECAAGKHGLPRCGEWDLQTEDTVVLLNTSEISVRGDEGQAAIVDLYRQDFTTIPGVDTVLCMRGRISLSAEQQSPAVMIWFSPPGVGLDILLQKYMPRLRVQNNEVEFDLISLDWRIIHTDDSLPAFSVYIRPTATMAIIQGLSLEIQQRGQCSDKAYSCIDCDASSLPANANYIRSRNCDWECNFEHERREDSTCMFCPYKLCDVGKCMADCEQCSACVKSDPLTNFISPGTTRGLNTSCATTCPAEHFRDPMKQVCTKCKSDITCSLDMYRKPCTAIHDMHCMGCSVCAVGSYETTPCSTTTDIICAQCKANRSTTGDLPEHATWTAATYTSDGKQECLWECNHGYVEDEIRQVCKICTHECGSGEYSTECTMHTGWEGCSPCVKPLNSTFIGMGRDRPMSCPWECNDGLELRDYECVEVFAGTLPPVPVAPLCLLEPGDCEPGHYPATSSDDGSEGGVRGSVSKSLCVCKTCAPPPNASIAQFIQRGNCEWVCSYPYIRSNGMCVRLLDITRMTRALP
ncbi:hypothetical protein T484DRAFT_1755975 [Baffinella frigidus]|nr:hypothetical protein T484DRAFT_1755975 [Cryptophyta sp. CCMP2293]